MSSQCSAVWRRRFGPTTALSKYRAPQITILGLMLELGNWERLKIPPGPLELQRSYSVIPASSADLLHASGWHMLACQLGFPRLVPRAWHLPWGPGKFTQPWHVAWPSRDRAALMHCLPGCSCCLPREWKPIPHSMANKKGLSGLSFVRILFSKARGKGQWTVCSGREVPSL